jgi:hypothetical protein
MEGECSSERLRGRVREGLCETEWKGCVRLRVREGGTARDRDGRTVLYCMILYSTALS